MPVYPSSPHDCCVPGAGAEETQMHACFPRPILVALLLLLALPLPAAASREERSLHDMNYVSPTWGYMIRWYGDEWRVDDQSSEDGFDSLWLANDDGVIAGFQGGQEYAGDATACLDDLIAGIEQYPGAVDPVIVEDEEGTQQISRDPWLSWVVLLVGLPTGEETVDQVVYLDCQTLVPGEAVLSRMLAGVAAGFDQDDLRFDVLNVALPRSALAVDPRSGMLGPGVADGQTPRPFPAEFVCAGFPRVGRLLVDASDAELGMMTVLDGEELTRVIAIENTSAVPLTIDPEAFVVGFQTFDGSAPPPDVAPATANWLMGGSSPITLRPGQQELLQVSYAREDLPEAAIGALVYRDPSLAEGSLELDGCLMGGCGCGGGARIPLRLSR
jgi:hypothetical protein